MADLYLYKLKISKVHDGDTVSRGVIDLGFNHRFKVGAGCPISGIRLFGIDTPELRGKTEHEKNNALLARDYLESACPPGSWVMMRSHKDASGKFGRILAEIFPEGSDETMPTVNEELIEQGLAVPYYGKGLRWRDIHDQGLQPS